MRHNIPFQCSTGPRSCPQRRRPPTGLVSVGRRSPPIVGATRRASPIPPAVEHKLGERRGEREDLEVEEAIEQALLRGLDGSGGLVTDAVPEAHVHEQTDTWRTGTAPSRRRGRSPLSHRHGRRRGGRRAPIAVVVTERRNC
jgi:hypothetical protein